MYVVVVATKLAMDNKEKYLWINGARTRTFVGFYLPKKKKNIQSIAILSFSHRAQKRKMKKKTQKSE